jgi:hypothetical protein
VAELAYALAFVALGVACLDWRRWMPRRMDLVRTLAVQRGEDPGEDVMRRRGMVLALRVMSVCGWLLIVASALMLATT